MIDINQTQGVLERIMTERRDAEAYFVTLIPAIKDPDADNIIRSEIQ
jgi:hypothetical protein